MIGRRLWLSVGGIAAAYAFRRWLLAIDRNVRREMVMPIFREPAAGEGR